MTNFTLSDLESIVATRAAASRDESYTARLKEKGVAHVAKKLGEESVETIIALVSEDEERVISESADMLYHLLVALHLKNIPVASVLTELARRTSMTGLAEKASRTPQASGGRQED
ncbi:phosphoribosyl-ATP diphosphatase [Fulvimarina sp. 2208YS6-2-32]|uniref:Phosphoribosyl-ATP pyrophosphatase n=1 Tax=Fulvimarina uroteuthidis TaxID=3098149 RepID=A0ABU5I6K9_9HYPH|nr:phosphoribosyl-ATP diphosphatase [Fulvimarina sp. 2208YS6-2-32]MDY8110846.1 phosphoribosyl-ATP diphosphatase [Fulvimarina sp. 2208YS6-2-32]